MDAHRAGRIEHVRCAVVTVSDTRTVDTDRSGARIRELLEGAGHTISFYTVVPDEPERVRSVFFSLSREIEAVVLNGGTGLGPRDSTFEAVDGLLTKRLEGFGELFRMLSYQEIGAAAMLSRATAGVYGPWVVFSLPGSTAAVELAMTKLVLPELGHIVWLVRGGGGG
ncbi:MAG: molybdenum cofactor biosynthesis protein B [Candidatus Binatia bacterium]|nr:MAG: molybdenum cofactor biosynthesis protein B [Candidatus Binatia bacterium]